MRKVTLYVTEKLTYCREVEVKIPDEIENEDDLNRVLDGAQKGAESASDFVHNLRRRGLVVGSFDDSLDSPDDSEIECDDYQFED